MDVLDRGVSAGLDSACKARHPVASRGQFKFQPAPNTAPSREVFRLEKPGYVSQDVLARSALRLGEFEYRLEVLLEPSGP